MNLKIKNNNYNKTNNMTVKNLLVNISIKFLLVLFSFSLLLFAILTYRAYVVFKPCEHQIKSLSERDRLKLNDAQIKRLQNALSFRTESYTYNSENLNAKNDFVNFIRSGIDYKS